MSAVLFSGQNYSLFLSLSLSSSIQSKDINISLFHLPSTSVRGIFVSSSVSISSQIFPIHNISLLLSNVMKITFANFPYITLMSFEHVMCECRKQTRTKCQHCFVPSTKVDEVQIVENKFSVPLIVKCKTFRNHLGTS